MNKPVYLGLSILDISKITMYEFWSNYVKPRYNEKAKSCYMDTGRFLVHVRTEDIYEVIAKDVGKRSNTLSYKLERLLPKRKNKKVIGLIKVESGEKVMKEFVGLRAKT